MNELPEYIVQLVVKSLKKELTEEEQKQIEEWKEAHPEQADEFKRLQVYVKTGYDISTFKGIDVNAAWKLVDRQTGRKKKRRLRSYWWAAAAVVIIFVGDILIHGGWQRPVSDALLSSSESFRPGSKKAVWELPGGEIIHLNEEGNRKIVNENGDVVGQDSMNVLAVASVHNGKMGWNKVRVPQGGEYGVVLGDGSRVWINSESELLFPSVFDGKERMVEVRGEAYFDVVKDARHPFVVKMGHSTVRVLGTSFNVCGYVEDGMEQTTLVVGSVEVDCDGKVYQLIPGEQLEIRKGSEPKVKKVDVRLYTSWKDGIFRFLDMPLDELTVKLKRWYDVNFVFENENCKMYRFSGVIKKDVDFNEFIQLIETTTAVKFEIEEDKITIKEK
ncbi:FecR domain-containing protein [Butyricimonas paravirosa]